MRTFVDIPLPGNSQPQAAYVDAAPALDMMTALLDSFAASLWRKIADGETLEPRDTVFLRHWTEFRSPCGARISAAEAQRLFGDAPTVTERDPAAVGINLEIEWDAPDRVLGNNASYARRKAAAQAAFTNAVGDAEERFIGACMVAFLAATTRGRPE